MKYTTSPFREFALKRNKPLEASTNNLNPHFVTGFSDAESCFNLTISKNIKHTIGWSVKLVFNIHLHSKDLDTLYLIQRFFARGNVTLYGDSAMYQVVRLSDLACVIDHFNNYPLKTQKSADFLLFKKAFDVVSAKEHLTNAGLNKLINIRASINKGLPKRLEFAFTNIIPLTRPKVLKANFNTNTLDIKHWIAGFVSGEGCFFIKISQSKTHKLGKSVALNFLVVQNMRDSYLLESFSQFFGCGYFLIKEKSAIGTFKVSDFHDIVYKIIPFFEEYPVLGVKVKDFQKFKEAAALIKSKAHLTKQGLDKILLLKSRMNSKR